MDIVHSIILGVVEGITEFLPVSSTFHLIFASKLLHVPSTEFLSLFEIFIQSGAILAACFLFAKDLFKDRELVKKTLVAFIPTAIIGFLLYKIIKKVFFQSDWLMVGVFVLMGVVFIVIELLIKNNKLTLKKEIKDITYIQALIIGVIQSFAVIPGVSRAGAVIVGMMGMGVKREEAARFSFILAIPTIFAASGYDLLKSRNVLMSNLDNVGYLLVGFIVSFITAYIVIKWFIGYLKTHTLISFAIYRFIVTLLIYFLGLIK